jgi:pimeloyl-ACP methyl ester carboxylesterase
MPNGHGARSVRHWLDAAVGRTLAVQDRGKAIGRGDWTMVKSHGWRGVMVAAALATATLAAQARAAAPSGGVAAVGTDFVGGRYTADGKAMTGQAHVLYLTPAKRLHKTALVFIPGAGQTITNFLSTPDGRPGWARLFVDQGWAVYLMDQPGRGASGYDKDAYGPANRQPPDFVAKRFTAPQDFPPQDGQPQGWPQAKLHDQWPGTGPGAGKPGDPIFDQFYASQVSSAAGGVSAKLVAEAGAALLDRIGSAVVITHSQSGAFGWAIGETRPDLVKAIVAVEPSGPPFFGAPPPWGDSDPDKLSRPWGLTTTPLAYDPPLADPTDLAKAQEAAPEGPGLVRCWRQPEPARKLTNLSRFPVMILVSEASYHAGYDHCTARYLTQAGVRTDLVRMADHGLRGDGHMLMLEKHSAEAAKLIETWLEGRKLD